jgi:hypothetical protein
LIIMGLLHKLKENSKMYAISSCEYFIHALGRKNLDCFENIT